MNWLSMQDNITYLSLLCRYIFMRCQLTVSCFCALVCYLGCVWEPDKKESQDFLVQSFSRERPCFYNGNLSTLFQLSKISVLEAEMNGTPGNRYQSIKAKWLQYNKCTRVNWEGSWPIRKSTSTCFILACICW